MKHQYFGDINDYRKYGLLRLLAMEGGLRVGVCWMLTPDDGRPDGGKIEYLSKPDRWRGFDPDLFDQLAIALKGCASRDLGVVEDSSLIPGARYHADLLEDGIAARAEYMRAMLDQFQAMDLIFFDPDNGLEVKSCSMGRKGSSKYLTCQEAGATFSTGASLLVFQHYGRVERGAFTKEQVQRLADSTGTSEIITLATAHVLYLLVLHPGHVLAVQRALGALSIRWPGQFIW